MPYAVYNFWGNHHYVFVGFIESSWPRNLEDEVIWRSFINLVKTKIIQCGKLFFFFFFIYLHYFFILKNGGKNSLVIFCLHEKGNIEILLAIISGIVKLLHELERLFLSIYIKTYLYMYKDIYIYIYIYILHCFVLLLLHIAEAVAQRLCIK